MQPDDDVDLSSSNRVGSSPENTECELRECECLNLSLFLPPRIIFNIVAKFFPRQC